MATKTAAKLQISMSFRDAGYERGLRKARRDTRTTQSAIQRLTPSISGLGAAAAAAGGAMAAIFGARELFRAGKKAVDLFSEQEDAVAALKAALVATGKEGSQNLDLITKAAARVQKQTRAADEELINASATLAQLAPQLNASELARAQEAIVGIADTFLEGNIRNAAVLVGKAIGSSTNALVRYGIEIDTAASQQEKLAQLLESTGSFFDVSKAKAKTFGGQVAQLKNFFGDMGEVLGEALLPPLREFGRFLLDSRGDIEDFVRTVAEQIGKLSKASARFLEAASVDYRLAFEALGSIAASAFVKGYLKGLKRLTLLPELEKLPAGLRFLLSDLNPGEVAFDIANSGLDKAIQDQVDIITTLANASDAGKKRLSELRKTVIDTRQGILDLAGLSTVELQPFRVVPPKPIPKELSQAEIDAIRAHAEAAAKLYAEMQQRYANLEQITPAAPTIPERPAIQPELNTDALARSLPSLPDIRGFGGTDLATEQLGQKAENAAKDAAERMQRVWGDFGRDTTATFQGIGLDLVEGLANGTLNAGDILKKAVIRLAQSFILGPLSGFLGIASPSKVTMGFGQELGRGLAIGIDSMRATVGAAAERLAQAAIPSMPVPQLAAAGGAGSNAMAVRTNDQPEFNFHFEAMFDPHREAQTSGGQAFIRRASDVARNSGHRFD